MSYTKITSDDTQNKGVVGLPDTPGLSTTEMQEKFDELVNDVVIPKFNNLVDELDASDIEKRIRKSVTIETSDIKSMTKYLETKEYEYVVEEEKKIVVFADIELNEIMPDLVSQNISIKSFYSTNETLESYYLNLIGGSKHE